MGYSFRKKERKQAFQEDMLEFAKYVSTSPSFSGLMRSDRIIIYLQITVGLSSLISCSFLQQSV